jgi:hypothetical protein
VEQVNTTERLGVPSVLLNIGALGLAAGAGTLRGQYDAHRWARTGTPDRNGKAFVAAGASLFGAGFVTGFGLLAIASFAELDPPGGLPGYHIAFQAAASAGGAGLGMLTYGLAYGRDRRWHENARQRGHFTGPDKPRFDGRRLAIGAKVVGGLAMAMSVFRYAVMACYDDAEYCVDYEFTGGMLGIPQGALNLTTIGMAAGAGVHKRRAEEHRGASPSPVKARKTAIMGGALIGAGVTGQLLAWSLLFWADPGEAKSVSGYRARIAGHVFGAQLSATATAVGAGMLGYGAAPAQRHRSLVLTPTFGPHLGAGIAGRF